MSSRLVCDKSAMELLGKIVNGKGLECAFLRGELFGTRDDDIVTKLYLLDDTSRMRILIKGFAVYLMKIDIARSAGHQIIEEARYPLLCNFGYFEKNKLLPCVYDEQARQDALKIKEVTEQILSTLRACIDALKELPHIYDYYSTRD